MMFQECKKIGNYDLVTPEGTRDLLFEESATRRRIESKLHKLFENYGYSEVITPGIEFYDVFNLKKRNFAQENMYKLSDSKGRIIVIRPDTTLPVARLVATRLRREILPLKLYYNQSIFRVNQKNSARDDEITQSGIEIIGGDVYRSDLESIAVALNALEILNFGDYCFELGNCALFKILIDKIKEFNISDEETEVIELLIKRKNYSELKEILKDFSENYAANCLEKLPELFGGAEVFEKAEKIFTDAQSLECLEYSRKVYDAACAFSGKDNISVDLGLIGNSGYYTGMMFRGYLPGFGRSVLSGGRYDTLLGDFGAEQPATGFAVNVDAATEIALSKNKIEKHIPPEVLVYSEKNHVIEAFKYTRDLIKKGIAAENGLFDSYASAKEYAFQKKIRRIDFVAEDMDNITTELLS